MAIDPKLTPYLTRIDKGEPLDAVQSDADAAGVGGRLGRYLAAEEVQPVTLSDLIRDTFRQDRAERGFVLDIDPTARQRAKERSR